MSTPHIVSIEQSMESRPMKHDDLLLNKYSLVKGAARRARQLQSGAPPLGVSNSLKACRVAEDEVRAGKVTYSVAPRKTAPPTES